MNRKPRITVVAGPNGAGKSSFQSLLTQSHLVECSIVNLDALDIKEDTLPEDPLRYAAEIAKRTDKVFKELCEDAIKNKQDFAFECNLRKEQVKYVGLFENAGYEINLIFLWLDDISKSFERVEKRVAEGGHQVGKISIESNYTESLKNLDEYFNSWDNVYIIDNSLDHENTAEDYGLPLIIYIKSGVVTYISDKCTPDILHRDFPNILAAYKNN